MKERRKFIRKLGGIAALMAMGTTAKATEKATREQGPFFHVVFFWLINDTQEVSKKFEHELRQFIEHVDEIRTSHIGTPADTDRDVIDNTWSYSLVLSFDSKEEHDIYQDHELHKKFIENASSLWTKVLVYDSVKL